MKIFVWIVDFCFCLQLSCLQKVWIYLQSIYYWFFISRNAFHQYYDQLIFSDKFDPFSCIQYPNFFSNYGKIVYQSLTYFLSYQLIHNIFFRCFDICQYLLYENTQGLHAQFNCHCLVAHRIYCPLKTFFIFNRFIFGIE